MQEQKTSDKIQNIVRNLILLQPGQLHDYLFLAELCVPLVKKGGIFIAMKGAAAEDELSRC